MGMSGSQAYLLTLTARLHDIEYQAQNIESQKVQLATEKDELYESYCNALDAKKIVVAFKNTDGSKEYIDANYDTLCGYSETRMQQYALTDAKTGKVYVSDEVAEAWNTYSNDKYSFAWAALGLGENGYWEGNGAKQIGGASIGINTEDGTYFMTDVEQMVFDEHSDDENISKPYKKLEEAMEGDDESAQKEALENFRDALYQYYGDEIKEYQCYNKGDTQQRVMENGEYDLDPDSLSMNISSDSKGEFQYYLNLYEQIAAAGGCTTIDPQYETGTSGSDWLNKMVSSGRVIVNTYNTTRKEWVETSTATSTSSNYIQEVEDETGQKKAEAEYEYELDRINDKDTDFDNELSNLETERTSITTEIESVEKIRDDNIDRTFGIFG